MRSTGGVSANSAQTAPYEKGTITETEFISKWMGLKYTLPDNMVMMTEEYLESLAASSKVQMEMQALMEDNSGDDICRFDGRFVFNSSY